MDDQKDSQPLFDGRYRLGELIGEGGMGKVFRAFDTKLERDVAVKVLHQEYSQNLEAVRRFIGEARAAARSHHENIVQVLDYGNVGDEYYIVLELLSGRCLRDMRLGSFADAQVADIFLQICDGLQAAHERGVVHRDLKPENIFLVPLRGGRARVKILDFGVALIRDLVPATGEEASKRRLTKAGTTLGTPQYMSIEQLAGRVDEIDGRSDIYALGVMMYEVITGAVPFDGDTYEQVCAMRLQADEPPRHGRMSERFWPIIKKAMAKMRAQRYATIAELRKDLERLDHKRSQAAIEVLPEVYEASEDTPVVERKTPPHLRKTELVWSGKNGVGTRVPRWVMVAAAVLAVVGVAIPAMYFRLTRRADGGSSRIVETDVIRATPIIVPTRIVLPTEEDAGHAIIAVVTPREDAAVPIRNVRRPLPRRVTPSSPALPRRRCVNRNATGENCVEIE